MNDIEILNEFINYPINSGEDLLDRFSTLDRAVRRGSGIEQFVYVPGTLSSKVLLVAHADTYWDKEWEDRGHDITKSKYGTGIGIGADNRAGCAILWLLKDSGHSLLITNGEEHGLLGASFLANQNPDILKNINSEHLFMIEFDMLEGNSLKTYEPVQFGFEKYVTKTTGYEVSEKYRRSKTDITPLCKNICGVNLSAGVYGAHTSDEYVNENEWLHTLQLTRNWLDGIQ